RFVFSNDDSRFMVQTDGMLTVSTFNVNDPQVPVLYFPKSGEGQRRRKREWVIPDINVPENNRGPFPLKISQIRSSEDKIKKIYYSITGPGADQPPAGLFTMDRLTGVLYVTQPLDREKQFQAHAVAESSGNAEEPMEIIVNVIDQNDNKPVFSQDTYLGDVPESSLAGFEVITVTATDADEPNTDNSDIRYRIISQHPQLPSDFLFVINPVTGVIRVNTPGLDREKYPQYTLVVHAVDGMGEGSHGEAKVILTVTDSNDNAPLYNQPTYEADVEENQVGVVVTTMSVTDGDEPHTPAWNAKFKIVSGDPGGLFNVTTGSNKQEGIITTAKGLDFEKNSKHTLLVAVENEVPFAVPLPTSTATVVVIVKDVNEPPVFDPVTKVVSKPENIPVNSEVTTYTATDPDTARKQTVTYKIISDPAGWLNVSKDKGVIRVKSLMDRESDFVRDSKYTALIGAYDNDEASATGTGTLVIQLEDFNDNAPVIEDRSIKVRFLYQNLNSLLLLLLLLFARRRKGEKREPLLQDDDIRDNIYKYDEEGGGEDDQDYDLSVLHRGLDNRPEVFRNDVVPNFMPAPQYRPRPANPEEIGNFIDDNLKAADNDPTAPPYDSLLVFDYEGGGSDAGSLSSLNSSSSGDQDYNCLSEWGPRFKKLADMYGGGEDDMM
uniref:Cadherin-1 n=1 Tax=Anabas testudineus TaxID=64144 RepID=A0A7N6BW78_ANATE